jgi:hypothetical protein
MSGLRWLPMGFGKPDRFLLERSFTYISPEELKPHLKFLSEKLTSVWVESKE